MQRHEEGLGVAARGVMDDEVCPQLRAAGDGCSFGSGAVRELRLTLLARLELGKLGSADEGRQLVGYLAL